MRAAGYQVGPRGGMEADVRAAGYQVGPGDCVRGRGLPGTRWACGDCVRG